MSSPVRRRPVRRAAFAVPFVALAACDGAPSGPDVPSATVPAPGPVLRVTPPARLDAMRPEALERLGVLTVSVAIDDAPVSVVRGEGRWEASAPVPADESAELRVDWVQRGGPAIASYRRTLPPASAGQVVTVNPLEYRYNDGDRDGFATIDEIAAETDFEDATSVPPTRPGEPDGNVDVIVDAIAADEAPEIDGRYDPIWDVSTQGDVRVVADNELEIDRVLFAEPASAGAEGGSGYRWLAMHDARFLYLLVLHDRADREEGAPPAPDGVDSLNVFLDGNHDRTEAIDPAADRYFVVLQRNPPDDPQVFAEQPLDDDRNALPAGFVAAIEPSASGRPAWELKIPLEDAGIAVGAKFGIELQIGRDGVRPDEGVRWGWSHPARVDHAALGYTSDSPRFNATAVLAE